MHRASFVLWVLWFLVSVAGCGSGTGDTTSTGGMGGSAGSTGTGTMCQTPADCPGQDTDCQKRTCDGGTCGVMSVAKGGMVAKQAMGNCQKSQCDGSGGVESVPDD